ncbi:hypothetical protein BJV74DRAFT_885023 [Russula compacta]|nr:hypothetical protein BJV74DRAFT_885023 [Russula compacta]
MSPCSPILHLPRFLDSVEKQYHSVQVISENDYFRISLLTHSESVNQPAPSLGVCSPLSPNSTRQMSAALSAKLATVKELLMVFIDDSYEIWDYEFKLPSFLRYFRSVKVLRVELKEVFAIARTLQPNHGESVIPDLLLMLEEMEILVRRQWQPSGYSSLSLTARQEAGHPVNISGRLRAAFPAPNLQDLFYQS